MNTTKYTTDKNSSKLIEKYIPRSASDVCVIAPHGGMEPWTATQAKALAREINAPLWACVARGSGVDLFGTWHITSTKISNESFSYLSQLSSKEIDLCVSFHGMTDDGIYIGGLGDPTLQKALRDQLVIDLPPDIDVEITTAGSYAGRSPANITNRLTDSGRGGIQIEQSKHVRSEHHKTVVDSVATILGVVDRGESEVTTSGMIGKIKQAVL